MGEIVPLRQGRNFPPTERPPPQDGRDLYTQALEAALRLVPDLARLDVLGEVLRAEGTERDALALEALTSVLLWIAVRERYG